ncbi:MAG: bifunctional 3-deoxy-7-phosphoheptulonate synthase/chorismate mutase type II [Paludibacteraceae bacterium]|nr:bifunctional 3-deoxy-7-phosphoheptulonate synthase/chorismate mutase type II [Paludibacteraceae bacterium]
MLVLGPCSAESREQVLRTARELKEVCPNTPFIFRAGVWKPRTNPNTFQGIGEQALAWLQEVQQTYGLEVATEVATPEHVHKALQAGIDYLWIGARTSANPITVQSLCEALKANANAKAVLIKNPVNADAALWLGNIERLEQTAIPVIAIHRGCNHKPCWSMAHTVRLARPDIPMLLDPSHLSGDAEQIPALLRKIAPLHLDGAMIEIHPEPSNALSDAKQQLAPNQLRTLLEPLSNHSREVTDTELEWLRAEIDELDDQLWETLALRMDVSRRIGEWKKAHNVAPLQPQRYAEILDQRQLWATKNGMDAAFVKHLFDAIHAESLKRQE